MSRQVVRKRFVPADDPRCPDETPFTRLSLTALRHSSREEWRDGSEGVGTGHLALGPLAVGEGPAHDVMTDLGVTYDALRSVVSR